MLIALFGKMPGSQFAGEAVICVDPAEPIIEIGFADYDMGDDLPVNVGRSNYRIH